MSVKESIEKLNELAVQLNDRNSSLKETIQQIQEGLFTLKRKLKHDQDISNRLTKFEKDVEATRVDMVNRLFELESSVEDLHEKMDSDKEKMDSDKEKMGGRGMKRKSDE